MNEHVKTEFLGCVLKLLGSGEPLSYARILYKTRSFRKTRRVRDMDCFEALRDFVELRYIEQKVVRSRIFFSVVIDTSVPEAVVTPAQSAPVFAQAVIERKFTSAQLKEIEAIQRRAWVHEQLKSMNVSPGKEEAAREMLERRYVEEKIADTFNKRGQLKTQVQQANEQDTALLQAQREHPEDAFK